MCYTSFDANEVAIEKTLEKILIQKRHRKAQKGTERHRKAQKGTKRHRKAQKGRTKKADKKRQNKKGRIKKADKKEKMGRTKKAQKGTVYI